MQNEPGLGPTRQDKTAERMKQERASPGVTSAGGPAGKACNDTVHDSASPPDANSPTATDSLAARRGDAAAPDERRPATTAREDRVREAAYRIFESRRGASGDATTDWLGAEAEIDALEGDPRDGHDPKN